MNPETRLESLHSAWMQLSGLTLPKFDRNVMHRWAHLIAEVGDVGMEIEQALPLVIARIKREAKAFHGYYAHLSFYKITDASKFTEHLSYAIAEARQPKPSATVKAIGQLTGKKYEAPGTEARKAEEIINSDGFKTLMKFRDNL